MSISPINDRHASWYTARPENENRDVSKEAYHNAVEELKAELGISKKFSSMPLNGSVSIRDVRDIIEDAQKRYEDRSKEHTGARKWLERLSNRIMYYSKVLETLASHHQEYVALAWGAIKFVFTAVINRATLVQKLAEALVAIADVLPRADLSAELYPTNYMESTLSRLYVQIILFALQCVRWYNRSSFGRMLSAIKDPFELRYQDIVEKIRVCSDNIENLANAGLRAEVRQIRALLELHHARSMDHNSSSMTMQTRLQGSMIQLMQTATAHKVISERISTDVKNIGERIYRLEFHNVMQFFIPEVLPDANLLKVQSLARCNLTPTLPSPQNVKLGQKISNWVLHNGPPVLVIRVAPRAQRQAKELAVEVIKNLQANAQRVFWSLSLTKASETPLSIADVFKCIIFQLLQQSGDLFTEFAEQLNLSKIHGSHTEQEWSDLVCLLLSKIPEAFIVLETEELGKVYAHDPDWVDRLLSMLQPIIERNSRMGTKLKILLVVHGGANESMKSGNILVTSLHAPTPVPPRMKHLAQRSGTNLRGLRFKIPIKY